MNNTTVPVFRVFTKDDLVILLKQYDFITHSVTSFSNKYNVNSKTVIKYLRENNIKYNNKSVVITNRVRDVNGRYCLNPDLNIALDSTESKKECLSLPPNNFSIRDLQKNKKNKKLKPLSEMTVNEKIEFLETGKRK